MIIVADKNQPLVDEYFGRFATVYKISSEDINNKALRESEADALVCRSTIKVDEKLLAGTKIKFVGTCTIGYDHVDTEYLQSEGIGFSSAAGCNAVSVAEYIVAVLIKIAIKYDFDLSAKVLGVVGVGNVGREVVKRARALGMNVLLNDPPRARVEGAGEFCSLDKILKNSDFVSLHVPLITEGADKTFAMANAKFFERMKNKAVFINACRGKVARDKDIIAAIDSGKILEAVIDVFETEPEISPELVEKSYIATGHISGHSVDGKINGTKIICNLLKAYFSVVESMPAEEVKYKESERILIPDVYTDLRAIEYAVDTCYDIFEDSEQLKAAPEKFSKLRKFYKKRYEFSHYSVLASDKSIMDLLHKLGFAEDVGE